ncbi:hypothetical protein BHM03_00018973 [Ensete ventricosum]|uniref:Transcription factor TFIIIB component B'' Myb domain-containing protein n=1 Tax=Ensete ventricosum TaxID=4639 RepID=A0A426XSY2_ENSVE|nr:hypothetical protein B296_00039218 [Ensete ventricosum]RZR90949.1 hypothetical protein BHM03_00018973 [Ensete ventricosum]
MQEFGTDFAMIQQLFPNHRRHQVKLKFKIEEQRHPLQVRDALLHRSSEEQQENGCDVDDSVKSNDTKCEVNSPSNVTEYQSLFECDGSLTVKTQKYGRSEA